MLTMPIFDTWLPHFQNIGDGIKTNSQPNLDFYTQLLFIIILQYLPVNVRFESDKSC